MAQRIPEETIEQIRSQTDIVDVIGEYMQLTKRGRNYFGLCPFHGEQTPSFSVSIDKQIFHCFGCGAGGNAITFLMDIDNISFQDAVARLGERVGIEVDIAEHEHQHVHKTEVSPEQQRMIEAHQFCLRYFQHLLLNTEDGEEGLQYLENRGFTREMIEAYGIGFALPSWDALTTLLTRKGYDLVEMSQAGLVIPKEDGSGYFDRFRRRVMFPIRNETGTVIGFSGRVIESDGDQAKYMNSPESPIFHKGRVLYNLDQARPIIRKERKVVLFEGFMDVLSAKTANVHNGVASMGTALTLDHVQKLKRLSNDIIVCYDGDNAGWEAAKRAADLLYAEKLSVEIAVLPNGLDPDDYIKQYGTETFREKIIGEPLDFTSFMMSYSKRGKNFQYATDVEQYVEEALHYVALDSSAVKRELHLKQLQQETGITQETLTTQLRHKEAQRRTEPERRTVHVEQKAMPMRKLMAIDRAERLILARMLNDIDIVDRLQLDGVEPPFVRDEYVAIYIHLLSFYAHHDKADFQRFAEMLTDSELRKLVMEAALVERDLDHLEEEWDDCLRQVEKYKIQQQVAQKKQQLKEAEKMHDFNRALSLSKEVIELTKSLASM
ncbi:DNA primase [Kurthia huakuii]|uniref:DNA primase n=1 Tax=Kurthia huakuii TaxID=1421019 RepID=UPI0004954C45|nr:DNA primase [Kurthia huakuii]MBM7697994.1 DNA primase [Kurthia huakuii]